MSGPTLRVLTLNAQQGLGGGRRRALLAPLRAALHDVGADLVFLQEVGGIDSPGMPDARVQLQYETLAEGMWPQHAYGRNAVAAAGHHGNALLSRHPIGAWHNIALPVGRGELRGLLYCRIDLPQAPALHAFCVHLGLDERQRQQQVGVLLREIETRVPAGAPLVVAGDFNDWRGRAHRRLLAGGLHEVHASRAGRPARTFPARAPLLRLDRIYVRHLAHWPEPLPVSRWRRLSDHLPVAAGLRMDTDA